MGTISKSHAHLHSLNNIIDVSQQVLSQHQPQPWLTLHWLVHVNVHIHRPVTLKIKRQQSKKHRIKLGFIICHERTQYLTPVLVVTRAFLAFSPMPETIC